MAPSGFVSGYSRTVSGGCAVRSVGSGDYVDEQHRFGVHQRMALRGDRGLAKMEESTPPVNYDGYPHSTNTGDDSLCGSGYIGNR